MIYFKATKNWVTLQILGRRLFGYSSLDDCDAIYVFNRAVLFIRFGKLYIGNLQKGV